MMRFYDDQSLAIKLLPVKGESLPGFLIRSVEANSYSKISWVLNSAGIDLNAGTMLQKPDGLCTLANILGCAPEQLEELSYRSAKPQNSSMVVLPSGQEISRYAVNLKSTKVCPVCIKDKGWIPWIWDLRVMTHCPVHGIPLTSSCSSCDGQVVLNRGKLNFCHPYCENDFDFSQINPCVLNLMRLICWKSGLSGFEYPDAGYDHTLREISLDSLLSMISLLVAAKGGLFDCRSRRLVRMKQEDLASGVQAAAEALNNWPYGYYKFLNSLSRPDGRGDDEIILKKRYGELYRALVEGGVDHPILLEGLQDYLSSELTEKVITGRGRSLAFADGMKRAYLPRFQARKILNITRVELRRLIDKGYFETKEFQSSYGLGYWIERESLERYGKLREAAVSLDECAKRLGASRHVIRKLAASGLLETLHSPGKDGSYRWLLTQGSIELLVKSILTRVGKASKKQRWISLEKAVESYNASGVSYDVLFRGILKGKVRISLQDGEKGLLKQLRLATDDLHRLVRCGSQLSLLIHSDLCIEQESNKQFAA